jgi:hypothetical protein
VQCFCFWHVFIHYTNTFLYSCRHAWKSRESVSFKANSCYWKLLVKIIFIEKFCHIKIIIFICPESQSIDSLYQNMFFSYQRWLFCAYSSWNFDLLYSRCIDIVTKLLQGVGNSSSIWRWIDFPAERISVTGFHIKIRQCSDMWNFWDSLAICLSILYVAVCPFTDTEGFVVANTV